MCNNIKIIAIKLFVYFRCPVLFCGFIEFKKQIYKRYIAKAVEEEFFILCKSLYTFLLILFISFCFYK